MSKEEQPSTISQAMIKTELKRNIVRSQKAYELYCENKKYICALRIYKANIKVYDLLEAFLTVADDNIIHEIINYLFHLEDWFAQFNEEQERLKPKLDDVFAFNRLQLSIPFPKNFLNKL